MRTNTIDETAFMLCNMAYKIGKETGKKPYFQNRIIEDTTLVEDNTLVEDATWVEDPALVNESAKDYCSVIKKVKKDNITLENIGEIMLCQIPGVSSVTAITILSKFKTLPALIKSLQDDPACLNGISATDANGKTRKISKTTIESIVKYLSQ